MVISSKYGREVHDEVDIPLHPIFPTVYNEMDKLLLVLDTHKYIVVVMS